MIDHVLNVTSRQQLIYAGHSQGTTAFWVMSMERPEYQNKVKVMFALAPVAHLANTRSPLFQVLSRFVNAIGVRKINQKNSMMLSSGSTVSGCIIIL